MKELTSNDFKEEVINSETPVLVKYWASWCPPCKMMLQVVEDLSKEYEGSVKFAKINVDLHKDVADNYDIMGVPTFILFRNGEEQGRLVAAQTKEKLRDLVTAKAVNRGNNENKNRVLVTGGCGFIGVNFVEYLLKNTDWSINVIDNLSEGKLEDLKNVKGYTEDRVTFYKGDINNEFDNIKAMRGCNYVVNLAAQTSVLDSIKDPINDLTTNILGLNKLLKIAVKNKIRRFVHASSAAVLGEQEMPMHEEKVPKPICPYGVSKLAGEAYCRSYSSCHDIQTIALRFSNVYGPVSYGKGSVIPKFIKQALKGEKSIIFGDGEQTRDFVHVKDICQGIFKSLSAEMNENFELIQLGTGEETSVNKFATELKSIMENSSGKFEYEYAGARSGEIVKNYTDISKAKRVLGYQPEINFKEGLNETVSWFLK